MRPGARALRLAIAGAAAAVLAAAPAWASWTATGRFVYTDREFDATGFTGAEPQKPVRFADVQIVDSKNKVLASGATDGSGNYTLFVVDSSTRTVYARVTTRSTFTTTLFVDVQANDSGKIAYYSVKTPNVSNHRPTTNVDFGTVAALIGQGGDAFNIFDQLVSGADYVAHLTGSRPPSSKDLTVVWGASRGNSDSYYQRYSRAIQLRDSGAYDDTVLLHEMGHYFIDEYSNTDSPGGSHTFQDCAIDLRLAYDEGYATYWGNSVLRQQGLPRPHLYVRTNGAPGPGNVVRYADLETDTQYHCQGYGSEVSVFMTLWDINDSAATPDGTPGVDDANDALSLPDTEVAEVEVGPVASASSRTFEDFWDGWFEAPVSNGFHPEMTAIAAMAGIDLAEDSAEANGGPASASPLAPGDPPASLTFFLDPDGDGAGEEDTDWFVFAAAAGRAYRTETLDLVSGANTYLAIVDTDGVSILAANDDRAPGDDSSLVVWTAPRSDAFYIRVLHAPDWGIYGSYRLSLEVD